MKAIYEDGFEKELEVLHRIHGLKRNWKRPIDFIFNLSDIIKLFNEDENKRKEYLNRVLLPALSCKAYLCLPQRTTKEI